MRKSPNTVYIGYDPKEHTAYEVLKFTIERIAVENVRVVPIKRDVVERMGMYTRTYDTVDGQNIDTIDGKPFSSEFSFTRFLVPAMNMYEGWALYMDCDMYLRTDINELFEEYNTDYYPLYCVKHQYEPGDGFKMDGKASCCSTAAMSLIRSLLLKLLIQCRVVGYMALSGCLIKNLI